MTQVGALIEQDGRVYRVTAVDERGNPTAADPADPADRDQGPPSPSVMDERGLLDRAVDFAPSIGGAVGGFLSRGGGPLGVAAGSLLAGAGGAGGEALRQAVRLVQGRGDEVPDTFGSAIRRIGSTGALNAAQEGGGRLLMGGLRWIAPKFMRSGLGAQSNVRKDFSDVDIDAVAVREGAIPQSHKSLAKVEDAAQRNAASVRNNLRAEDISSGNAPVAGYDDAVAVLRDRVRDARMAARGGSPEELNAIKAGLKKVSGLRRRPLNAEETFVSQQSHMRNAKSALNAQAGAEGDATAEVAQAIGSGLNARLKAALPEHANKIQRQQELIALERALFNAAPRTSILGNTAAATTGAGVGALTSVGTGDPLTGMMAGAATAMIPRLVTSPRNMGRAAVAADRMAGFMGGLSARVPDVMVRQMMLELLLRGTEEQ